MTMPPALPSHQPLQGLKIIEFEGLGPGPLAGRILAQGGAEVTLVARPAGNAMSEQLGGAGQPMRHGKQVVVIDLKTAAGVAQALDRVAQADALIEGNRPGVMERLGLSPLVDEVTGSLKRGVDRAKVGHAPDEDAGHASHPFSAPPASHALPRAISRSTSGPVSCGMSSFTV